MLRKDKSQKSQTQELLVGQLSRDKGLKNKFLSQAKKIVF